ncbi:MAG: outer membrane lipoprotein carrier protein LolA [Phaeodactylibacter sp.]|uniref:LolA family protein n=1 Tax=Phaeodactylibacter sp. TaxID=1940289 RepID=UPI0032EE8FF4
MKKFLFSIAFLALIIPAFAQDNTVTSAEDSDPRAKAILDEIRKRFESYESLGADFTLEITFPEEPMESQKGEIAKQGDQFRMSMASQTVISDGETLWMIFDHNKEVQINTMPDEAEMGGMVLSPESLLNFYDHGDFAYFITGEAREAGQAVQQIEFKPLDRNAEYTKLRMNVNKATKDVVSVTAFGRDGSRYKLRLDSLTPNKRFPAGQFAFNKADYPGYYIEDLRE